MSVVSTSIVNLALVRLGVPDIATIDDLDSEPARKAKLIYTLVCEAEIRRHQWSFAMWRDSLAALATAPTWGYQYAYNLPSDFLRLIQANDYFDYPEPRIGSNSDEKLWMIEGRTVLTNLGAPLKIRYIRKVAEDAHDPIFNSVLAYRLAMELAPSLTQSTTKVEQLTKLYKDDVREARRVNAIELPPQPLPDNSWMNSRLI